MNSLASLLPYDGIEVDMLSLGGADAILVTRWFSGRAQRVLNKADAPTVKNFLLRRGARYIDHVVATHPHDDHSGGLVELLGDPEFRFGQFWMHLPWNHINVKDYWVNLQLTEAKKAAKILTESLQTQLALTTALGRRGVVPLEPFAGTKIGFMNVLGPSLTFYRTMVGEFKDLEKLMAFEGQITAHERAILLEEVYERYGIAEGADGELGGEPTEPENDSCVILGAEYNRNVFLFTADAGVPALENVANGWTGLRNCKWMQVPHHGSRRNISEDLIDWFKPEVAFVSACGDRKHPRQKVVNAFKKRGTNIYSTHYPDSGDLWYSLGFIPTRVNYGPATELYN